MAWRSCNARGTRSHALRSRRGGGVRGGEARRGRARGCLPLLLCVLQRQTIATIGPLLALSECIHAYTVQGRHRYLFNRLAQQRVRYCSPVNSTALASPNKVANCAKLPVSVSAPQAGNCLSGQPARLIDRPVLPQLRALRRYGDPGIRSASGAGISLGTLYWGMRRVLHFVSSLSNSKHRQPVFVVSNSSLCQILHQHGETCTLIHCRVLGQIRGCVHDP